MINVILEGVWLFVKAFWEMLTGIINGIMQPFKELFDIADALGYIALALVAISAILGISQKALNSNRKHK